MGVRVGRASLFYTVISCLIFPIGLANALLLTHFLTAAQYGQLSVLFAVSGLATVILNLIFLRGTETMVWGSSDEGIAIDDEEMIESHKRPRALGTGLVLSIVFAVLTVATVVPVATPISRALVGTPHLATAVIWSAASAGLGSVYRLVWNIVRWERRHRPFAVIYTIRPVLAIAIAWPLVATGAGVTGAVAATAIGTLCSCLVGMLIERQSYKLVLDRSDAITIMKRSAPRALLMIGVYALHNGDVVLLSRFASEAQVGVYRLAGNLTSVVSYAVSAFLMAWAPLEHGSLFQATYQRHGRARMRGEFVIYFLVVSVLLTLVMSALAAPVVGVFSSRYSGAEAFVAITSAGWVAYGLFIVIARSSDFPRRYLWYGIGAVASVGGLVGTSVLLGPPLGGYGVATGDVVGGLVGVAVIVGATVGRGELPAVSLPRTALLLVAGGVCYVIGAPLADHAGSLKAALKVVSVALYPLLLTATGVVPVRHLGALWEVLRNTLRSRSRPEALIDRVPQLSSLERRTVLTIARDGQPPARVTAISGVPETTVKLRFVSALRRLADAGSPGPTDHAIADYLLTSQSTTQRDGIARELWKTGVKPVDLHKIETAFDSLRAASPKAWSATVVRGGRNLPPSPWPIHPSGLRLLDEVLRRNRPRQEVAAELGIALRDLDRRLIGTLRTLIGGGGPKPVDGLIAAFLLHDPDAPPARQLWAAGVDPLELHELEMAIAEVRSLAKDRWREVVAREPVDAEVVEPAAVMV
jgi:O-antigen/teichoic acid export membrane protein